MVSRRSSRVNAPAMREPRSSHPHSPSRGSDADWDSCGSSSSNSSNGSLSDGWDRIESPSFIPVGGYSHVRASTSLNESPGSAAAPSKCRAPLNKQEMPKSPRQYGSRRHSMQAKPSVKVEDETRELRRRTAPIADILNPTPTPSGLSEAYPYSTGSAHADTTDITLPPCNGIDVFQPLSDSTQTTNAPRESALRLAAARTTTPSEAKVLSHVYQLDNHLRFFVLLSEEAAHTIDSLIQSKEEWTHRYRKSSPSLETSNCPHAVNLDAAMNDRSIPCLCQNQVFLSAMLHMDAHVTEQDHLQRLGGHESQPLRLICQESIHSKIRMLSLLRAAALETVSCTRPGLHCLLAAELLELCLRCATHYRLQADVMQAWTRAMLAHCRRCELSGAQSERHRCHCGYGGGRGWLEHIHRIRAAEMDPQTAWSAAVKSYAARARRVGLWQQARQRAREQAELGGLGNVPEAARKELDRMAREYEAKLLRTQARRPSVPMESEAQRPAVECTFPSLPAFESVDEKKSALDREGLPLRSQPPRG